MRRQDGTLRRLLNLRERTPRAGVARAVRLEGLGRAQVNLAPSHLLGDGRLAKRRLGPFHRIGHVARDGQPVIVRHRDDVSADGLRRPGEARHVRPAPVALGRRTVGERTAVRQLAEDVLASRKDDLRAVAPVDDRGVEGCDLAKARTLRVDLELEEVRAVIQRKVNRRARRALRADRRNGIPALRHLERIDHRIGAVRAVVDALARVENHRRVRPAEVNLAAVGSDVGRRMRQAAAHVERRIVNDQRRTLVLLLHGTKRSIRAVGHRKGAAAL